MRWKCLKSESKSIINHDLIKNFMRTGMKGFLNRLKLISVIEFFFEKVALHRSISSQVEVLRC